MSKKVSNETVYDAVVIRAWMIPGPGDDVDNPRWLSSYSVGGAPPVTMRGDGDLSHEEAALQAVNAVQSYLAAQIARFPPHAGAADAGSKPR
jgi:hypothetical protein